MNLRHIQAQTLAALTALALGACSMSHGDRDPPDAMVPDGGEGVCCPVTDFTGCSPGFDPLPGGGWAPSLAGCTYTIDGHDGPPWVRVTDEYGCPRVEQDLEAMWCGVAPPIDAGPDSGPPGECDGRTPAECLSAEVDCVPAFDDACCPACSPVGACADCVDWTFLGCVPRTDVCLTASCEVSPSWACGPAAPTCELATQVSPTSCDQVGCVPAAPIVGGPPLDIECVAILAESCTVACRQAEPPCPEGMVAEGDGSCYTGRCIPGFVCGR